MVLIGPGIKSFVGNYRAAMSKAVMGKISMNSNPFTIVLRKWKNASDKTTSEDQFIVSETEKLIDEESKYSCFTCSGYGHIYTDF